MDTTLTVTGMSCGHCEATVEDALAGVDGVESVTADHEADEATIEGTAPVDDLVAAVEDAGYDASTSPST
ncbi:heavy-metal-associated domain-containing protein [Haloarchaeobius sp. TZWWS8]|uniref:heavy-metal-associated domain-containing protein n=1 Tax=Haloarchaeobius sp. TZWWS8 TaxID=3446121 RepID=UPI003EB95304